METGALTQRQTPHGDLPAVVPTATTIEAAKSFVLTAERFHAETYNFALRILASALDAQDTQQIRATFTALLAVPTKPSTFPKALAARSALAYEAHGHDLLCEHLSAATSAAEFARLAHAEVITHAGHAIAALVAYRLQKALSADDHAASLIYAENAHYCFHALASKGPREIKIATHSLGYAALLDAYRKGLNDVCLNLYPSLIALHEASLGLTVPISTTFAETVFGKLQIPHTEEELTMLQIVFENLAKNEPAPSATIHALMRAQTELPIPAADLLRDPDLIRTYGELMGRVKTYLDMPPSRQAVA